MKRFHPICLTTFLALLLALMAAPVSAISVSADLSRCEDPTCTWRFGDGNSTTGCGAQDYSYSDPGTYNATFSVDCGAFSQEVTRQVSVGGANIRASCQAHLEAGHTKSGVYEIDPDGEGGQEPFKAYCDQKTNGGGWMLVLNYLHKGGTNPSLNIRSDSLPLQGDTTLSTDESGTKHWGHASNSMFSKLPVDEVRFFCQTSNHERQIHFKTTNQNTINYFRTGTGMTDGVKSNYTLLNGHTANLPQVVDDREKNAGEYAMTEFPYYSGGNNHWGIKGRDTRWECDDFPSSDNYHTYHQVWVR